MENERFAGPAAAACILGGLIGTIGVVVTPQFPRQCRRANSTTRTRQLCFE
jgi:hypothetical protein